MAFVETTPGAAAGGQAQSVQASPQADADTREGRDSEASRAVTRQLLFAGGRPRPWLLVLLAACLVVLVRAVH